ncbi:MAG TPA: hypothetical protein VK451_10795 [Methyloceanibacter sp.]|nr:hypothetical protein [Methyloceanibacter sp.]
MFGSTTPLTERPDLHPVHRANALLRSALLNEAAFFPKPGLTQPFDTIAGPPDGPVGIAYPQSLVARLNALDFAIEGGSGIRVPLSVAATGSLLEDMSDLAPPAWDEHDGLRDEETQAGFDDAGEDDHPAIEGLDPPTQAHMLALVREFQRRQRQANFLVAGSLAAAVLLTLGCFVLIAHLAAPDQAKGERAVPARSSSISWQRPEGEAMLTANRAEKSEALLIPAKAVVNAPTPVEDASPAQVTLVAAGRKLALAPLIGPLHARYALLRGLPPEAELSAGQRTASGSWMVKDEEMPDLSLTMGEAANGDYPVDIYLLDAGNAPQARRSLVLRVEPSRPRVYTAGLSLSWASALLDAAAKAPATTEQIAPAESSVLLARAKLLLSEGDIAGARLLLFHLAERGEGDAAYELARTFDAEMLKKLGASGVESDPVAARSWYEQASQRGSAEAAERLKILASLSVSDPSD